MSVILDLTRNPEGAKGSNVAHCHAGFKAVLVGAGGTRHAECTHQYPDLHSRLGGNLQ